VDNFYLSALVEEMAPEVQGRAVARISLEAPTLLIDLRLTSGRQLLASLDRNSPAIYLSHEVASKAIKARRSSFFLSLARKHLMDARLIKVWKDPRDRIVHFYFEKTGANDNQIQLKLWLALTGRSSNAYLTDAQGKIIGTLFEQTAADELVRSSPWPVETLDPETLIAEVTDSMTEAQVLDRYFGLRSHLGPQFKNEFLARSKETDPVSAVRSLIDDLFHRAPLPLLYSRVPLEQTRQVVINPKTDLLLSHIELTQARDLRRFQFGTLSEAADEYYSARGPALALRAEYSALKQTLSREIGKRESALSAINSDRARFEHPEKLKRWGDLLLANLANAQFDGTSVTVVDYYDPEQAEIQIEIPERATLTEAASGYFARYQKARRALAAIASREQEVFRNLAPLKQLLLRLVHEPTAECTASVSKSAGLLGITSLAPTDNSKRGRTKGTDAFGRKFKSSDGYEIVVGRNDRDNDALTFRVAKPNDIWLHAADYPGSHAIIRNPTRGDLPHRTITEAAELAAFYSQAKREGKAAVHYAQKKFVSKPPRSKPGLVRLSSFKTILVEPRCTLERLP
jgi:predicted ribosome quality control (RQC) complex YloA/Tae2 family protein